MRAYTVHEPPRPPADRHERALRLAFVREGFSWVAALFGPLWMLFHRMWLVLVGFIVLQVALELALASLRVSSEWMTAAFIAVQVALGFEAAGLRRWTLARKGWRMIGSVTGDSALDAERRFFEAWLAEPADTANVSAPEPAQAEEPRAGWRGWFRWARPAGSHG